MENDTISREIHELEYAAKELDVPPSTVLKAIEYLKTNRRSEINQYIIQLNQETETLESAVKTFGVNGQVEMLIEEASEVIQAMQKLKRVPNVFFVPIDEACTHELENVYAELADLRIMLDQMDMIFDREKILSYRASKLARLKQRIEEHESNNR